MPEDPQLPVDTQPALRCFDRKIFEGERGSVEGEPSVELRKARLVLRDADCDLSAGEPSVQK